MEKIIDLLLTKIKYAPNVPENYINLANTYYKINNMDLAIKYYKLAQRLDPNQYLNYFYLGNCYTYKNDFETAINYYKHCLQLAPDFIKAHQNLGALLLEHKQFQEALPYLEKAYEHDPTNRSHLEFNEQLADCHLQLGNLDQVIKYLSTALTINPNKGSIHHNLGVMYLKYQQNDLAKKHFKIALELDPNNQTATHMINSLEQITSKQPPAEYVIDLFDQYASYYEQHMLQQLNYKLPYQFRHLYAKHAGLITAKNTLDLGAGTGLCGIYFRDCSINLVGVDLTKNMLLEAKKHHCYDLLIQANLQQNNIFKQNHFDLITAADLLPYFGDLDQLFNMVHLIILKNNLHNMFIFNIESLNLTNVTPNLDLQLQTSGRYAHSEQYIHKLSKKFNFTIIDQSSSIIRTNLAQPIYGNIFILRA